MEKLIELLKEYAPEDFNWCVINGKIFDSDRCWTIMNVEMGVYVISKQFWFIQWLVDNDKIDLDKLKDNTSFTMLTHSIWLWCEWHTAHEWENILRVIWTNAIIAYLSIQDKPIEFLISILK